MIGESTLLHWQNSWQEALSVWSRYTRLRNPLLCASHVEAAKQGLIGSFAMIRFQDQAVVIDMKSIDELDLHDCATEILAHEVGHHVLTPATTTDHTRMIARMLPNLPSVEKQAGMVANLYTDLLINHHLKNQCELQMDKVYRKLNRQPVAGKVWPFYLRMYEILWLCEQGELGGGSDSDAMEGDAWLGARIIKVYSRDTLKGAARFSALLLPYLLAEKEISEQINSLMDTRSASQGQIPAGLIEAEQDADDNLHPSEDRTLVGDRGGSQPHAAGQANKPNNGSESAGNSDGQYREPFEYGEILRAAGISINDHEVAVRYYKERALPHLVPFPRHPSPQVFDQIPEGTELWELGEPLENVDWFSSRSFSSVVIPGVTTMQRVWGDAPGNEPEVEPCNLDIYVDCSGSMPNPQLTISYTALAGTILCLSALRAGAAVQATLWSGKNQVKKTDGFVRNEKAVLATLTDYLGGATAFPLHVMRNTYLEQPVHHDNHIVVLSDDGVTTMFQNDEQYRSGWDIAGEALKNAGGGGTMVLNLGWNYPKPPTDKWYRKDHDQLIAAEKELGWSVFRVAGWEEMLEFAKQFSLQHYRI